MTPTTACGIAVDGQRLADRRRVAAEQPPRQPGAEHHDPRRPGIVVGGGERPALRGLPAQHVEERPDAQPPRSRSAPSRQRDDALGGREAGHRLERRRAAHPVVEVARASCCRGPRRRWCGGRARPAAPASANGSAFSITPCTTLKMAVLAPMASAMVRDAHRGEAGAAPQQASRRSAGPGRRRDHARVSCRVVGRPGAALVGPPRRRRVAALAPGEAERAPPARASAGHAPAPRGPRRARLVAAARRTRRPSGRRAGLARSAGQQLERAVRVEARGQPASCQALRGVSRFCRAIFTARSSRAASARATSSPSRLHAVVAAPRVVVAGTAGASSSSTRPASSRRLSAA